MDAMFGLSMNTILYVLVGLLAFSLGLTLLVFIRNRIIFMIGLRNIPRRVSQTVLIVIGLMLSTVIITAAFTTGDTVDYSITKQAYDLFGHVDTVLDGEVARNPTSVDDSGGHSVSKETYRDFLRVADDADLPHVDGYAGVVFEPVPVINERTKLSEPNVVIAGIDADREGPFEDIVDKNSGEVLRVTDLGPDELYLNEDGADSLDAQAGDTLSVYINGQARAFTIKAIVKNSALTGAVNDVAREGMVASLASVQEIVGTDRLDFIAVSGTGGIRDLETSRVVAHEVEGLIESNRLPLEVSDTKHEVIADAEEIGNFMATFFLLLGLFSIGAGMLLIVMIFVMLAAERKSEMGMARAVGTKRLHLIEMFLAEGTGYDLISAIIGVVLGVGVAFALTTAASAMFSSFGLSFTPHATARTIAISYSLGVVLTFITVVFSSWRVSNLNIVAAIRDISEVANKRMGWRGLTFWIVGLLFAALMIFSGLSSNSAFPFAFGVSLGTMGVAVLLTHFGSPARLTYSISGIFLLIFWGLTAGDRLESIFGVLEGDIEMFFLSGAAMVTASTFVIVYNVDIFLAFVERIGGAFGSILPAMRTAVAYPAANRFRTGMTLAMISIVVFALTMMSAMNLNYEKLFLADDSRGGWDVQVQENPNNPIDSVAGTLSLLGSDAQSDISDEGAILSVSPIATTEVTQDDPSDWSDYPVRGLTNGFIDAGSVPLDKRAAGYDSAEAVWQALKTDPDVAIADGFVLEGGGFDDDQYSLEGIPTDANIYETPPVVTVRDPVSGRTRDVKIIGIIAFGASSNFMGFQMGEESWRSVFGDPGYAVHYLTLNPGADSDAVAKKIEAALVTRGAQADSLKKIAEENNALSRNFLYLMQAFMGLGLVVGIAAIGVIAFRTVVERRQQIGMLRAIGYKKSTVALSFLIESSFVTVLGVASGTILGLFLSYFLVTSDSFPAEGQPFYIPWVQIGFFIVVTLAASLAMTWIPARQAASVPTAEALRYE
jgi:putative ABC transport system permease protein